MKSSNFRSRFNAVLAGLVSTAAVKWLFDRGLWDVGFRGLYHIVDIDMAEPLTAILSYGLPLAAGTIAYAVLSPHSRKEGPVLRKHAWQSRRFIVALIIIVVALVAGLSFGRLFGLPSVTLPSER